VLAMKPLPEASASEPRCFAFTDSRNDVVVRAGIHSTVRAARCVDRVLPRIAPAGARDGGRATEARHRECIAPVLCLAVPVVARARSCRPSAAQGKDGGGGVESIACPETGRVGI
jgi:hypothetical protein